MPPKAPAANPRQRSQRKVSNAKQRRDLDALLLRVRAAEERLRPLFPDMDPGDLNLILYTLLRPPEERVSFIREIRPGVYAV